MKKYSKIIIPIFIIIIIIGSFLVYKNKQSGVTDTEIKYEYSILDESVLSQDEMKSWVEENSKVKGFYETKDDEYSYVLISYGETTKSQIGICLENIKSEKGNKVSVEYSIIDNNGQETEKYIPKMILRFENRDLSFSAKEIENK